MLADVEWWSDLSPRETAERGVEMIRRLSWLRKREKGAGEHGEGEGKIHRRQAENNKTERRYR